MFFFLVYATKMNYFALNCLLFVCFTFNFNYISSVEESCKCKEKAQCEPVTKWDKTQKEDIIMTDHSTQYEKWMWKAITTVVSTIQPLNNDLMCYAHSKGVKYGITMDIIADYDGNSSNVTKYIKDKRQIINITHADVVMLNLMPLIGRCDNAKDHVQDIINVTQRVITELKGQDPLRVICVVPWKPPCYDSDCMVGPALAQVCDAIEVNPDSFLSYCNDACVARATVPFSRMEIGLREYEMVGFLPWQILIGIPWHGYNYTCDRTFSVNRTLNQEVCFLKRLEDGKTCDINGSRVRVNIERFDDNHPALLVRQDKTYDEVDQAPYTLVQETTKEGNKTVTTTYMGWYENIASLHAKYEIVRNNKYRGAVIYSGDDLTYTNIEGGSGKLDDSMWAWLFHIIFSSGEVSFDTQEPDYAAIVAGVGVSMFVLGCLLGVIFACIIFRRNKKLKPPFHRDTEDIPEFHDDDQEL